MSESSLHVQFQVKLASLKECLDNRLPNRATILEDIWKTCRAQPENVTLMSDEEIGLIVSGLMQQRQVEIIKPAAAKKVASKSLKANLGLLNF